MIGPQKLANWFSPGVSATRRRSFETQDRRIFSHYQTKRQLQNVWMVLVDAWLVPRSLLEGRDGGDACRTSKFWKNNSCQRFSCTRFLFFFVIFTSYKNGVFTEDMIPTVGFNMRKVTKGRVTMKIWDIGGQPRFRSMWERYCRGVNAIVYIFWDSMSFLFR